MLHHVVDPDPVKIEDLAAGKNGRDNFMAFGGSQNENGIARRFFQRFLEGVESRIRKHVNLIDDVDLVLSGLRRVTNLFYEVPDVFHGVVGSSIELVHIKRSVVVETYARFALVTSFGFGR